MGAPRRMRDPPAEDTIDPYVSIFRRLVQRVSRLPRGRPRMCGELPPSPGNRYGSCARAAGAQYVAGAVELLLEGASGPVPAFRSSSSFVSNVFPSRPRRTTAFVSCTRVSDSLTSDSKPAGSLSDESSSSVSSSYSLLHPPRVGFEVGGFRGARRAGSRPWFDARSRLE